MATATANDVYDPRTSIARTRRRASIALAGLVLGLGLPLALVPIGGAVVGSGQVGAVSRIQRIAHPTGGIVSGIAVRNGDRVRKGDVLVRFDATVSGADAQLSTLSVDQLLAQRGRLEAERLGSERIAFPTALTATNTSGARQAIADERQLFVLRREEADGLRAQLAARTEQYNEQIAGYRLQIGALQRQAALIEPELRGLRGLWEKGLVTITRLNQVERAAVEIEGRIGSLRSSIAETQARISEAREQEIQLGDRRRSEAGTQLATVNGALNQQQVRSVSARDSFDRSVMRAPYSGTVDKLAFSTIGDVVKPAETIMEIVPDEEQSVVEGAISPADIDRVRAGQRARVRLTAFNMTTTPEFAGTVMMVAATSTTEPTTQRTYYPIRIALDAAEIARQPGLKLVSGMPAEVYVETPSRSMLSFILKPLRDQFARAFKSD